MIDAKLIIFDGDGYINLSAIIKVQKYIFRVRDIDKRNKTKPLPICCYGCITYPPTYESFRADLYTIRYSQSNIPARQLWYFAITFKEGFEGMYQFADDVAKIFSYEYQICYAFHNDTDNPHFHYMVSATSYLRNFPCLDDEKMKQYLVQIEQLAQSFSIELDIHVKDGVDEYVGKL